MLYVALGDGVGSANVERNIRHKIVKGGAQTAGAWN
jgi:hypothetical protein